MGNAQSGLVFRKLSKEIPPVKKMGHDEEWKYRDLGWKVFEDEEVRNQFIHAIIAVATNNGITDLEGHDFKLFYTRRESNPDRVIARIVAVKDGKIAAKIEPEGDGADQREAFVELKKDIEIKLDRILQDVPSRPSDAGPSRAAAAAAGTATTTATGDAPPAYSSPSVGIADRKKKG